MSIITLLTDFGTDDEYVGLMKGVMLSIDPSISIVDITHHIDPQNIVQAAYTLKSSYRYFPRGTVHVIVVDPGVGGKRAIIALEMMGHVFLVPDNGVLTLLFSEGKIDESVRVDNSAYYLKSVSPTFHGRDMFAPVAAHIAKGVALKRLGSQIDEVDLVRLYDLGCFHSDDGELVGKIVSIDHFGNVITDIDSDHLMQFCGAKSHRDPRIQIGGHIICGFSDTYESAESQAPLALIGSRGYLEIAVNTGSAEKRLNVQKGDRVKVVI